MSTAPSKPEALNKCGTEQGEAEDSEEEERYYDSGLPPPSPFNRRGSGAAAGDAFPGPARGLLPRSMSADHLFGMKERADERRFPLSIDFLKTMGSPASTSTSEPDVFAERKKKLTSRVMTLSMPDLTDLRNVRAMYNQGIGKSLRIKSSETLDEEVLCTNYDSTFDNLLSDTQGDSEH